MMTYKDFEDETADRKLTERKRPIAIRYYIFIRNWKQTNVGYGPSLSTLSLLSLSLSLSLSLFICLLYTYDAAAEKRDVYLWGVAVLLKKKDRRYVFTVAWMKRLQIVHVRWE